MEIHVKISAPQVANGKFKPEIHFYEVAGNLITNIMPWFGEESLCNSKDEALNLAKAHAMKFASEKYGPNAIIVIDRE